MRLFSFILVIGLAIGLSDIANAQRAASPPGEAATQLGSREGPWIVVDYSRPILRGRTNIFGSGEEYGAALNAGAPVWRAGANKSTRFMTEADLMIGGQRLPAGEYSLFVDLKPGAWTLIFSNHEAKDNFRDEGDGLWGSYNYSESMDQLRVPMQAQPLEISVDQFTISFMNVSATGGNMALIWGYDMAMVSFSVAE